MAEFPGFAFWKIFIPFAWNRGPLRKEIYIYIFPFHSSSLWLLLQGLLKWMIWINLWGLLEEIQDLALWNRDFSRDCILTCIFRESSNGVCLGRVGPPLILLGSESQAAGTSHPSTDAWSWDWLLTEVKQLRYVTCVRVYGQIEQDYPKAATRGFVWPVLFIPWFFRKS